MSTTLPIIFETGGTLVWMTQNASKKNGRGAEETIGQRIAILRKKRALTQEELANQIGLSQALLSAYELGKARISADLVVDVAKALKVPAGELLGIAAIKDSGPLQGRRLLRRLTKFENLPRRKQDALLQTIDAVLETSEPQERAQ